MPKYSEHLEVKRRIKAAGLKIRDIAHARGESPITWSGRLNGYSPLTEEHIRQVELIIRESKAK